MTARANSRVRDLTTSVEHRLLQPDQGPDLAPVLTLEAVNEAHELITLITDDHVESLLVLGWFYSRRVSPERQQLATARSLLLRFRCRNVSS